MVYRMGVGDNHETPTTVGGLIGSIVRGLIYSAVVAVCGAILVSLVQLIGGWDIQAEGVFQAFSYLSMATGGFMAARQAERNGWLVGGIVGVLFILGIGWFTSGSLLLSKMSSETTLRIGIGFLVGAVGGILGVNT